MQGLAKSLWLLASRQRALAPAAITAPAFARASSRGMPVGCCSPMISNGCANAAGRPALGVAARPAAVLGAPALRALVAGRQQARKPSRQAASQTAEVRTAAAPQADAQAPGAAGSSALLGLQQHEQEEPPRATTFVLDVGGMKCGGCSAAVKRMLSQQEYVLSSGVNLVTSSAAVGVPAGDGAEALAQRAADALTSRGFPSHVRQPDDDGMGGVAGSDGASSPAEDRTAMLNLAFAWGLVAFCCLHHAGHLLHDLGMHSVAHLPVLHAMGNPWISGVLGAAALLGPGRGLLADGATALVRGSPNMNSLIGLGAATSFVIGAASSALPGLHWDASFVEEPVMLLAFVLLGRTLEARARARASADLRSLASLIPSQSRLVLDATGGAAGGGAPPAAADSATTSQKAAPRADVDVAMVPTRSVRAGDVVRVLPGERFPVDGQLLPGCACGADESMLTGESLPVAKAPGDSVLAGTVCYEGAVALRATSTGADSRLAGIGRLVTDAQAREAPVQRLADAVAGRFCYAVMAASGATFAFWSLAGAHLFPWVLDGLPAAEQAAALGGGGAATLLATKLAVDVLVVACPCALGLATPTAVVVASSAGAKRGLLLRGGDVIEALAGVDTVVLDKTGTLTQGRLRLRGVHAAPDAFAATEVAFVGLADGSEATAGGGASAGQSIEDRLLALAGAVEAHTRHPVADAVLAACAERGLSVPAAERCLTVPGEGASGVVGGRLVAVGKLGWVMRQVQQQQQQQGDQQGGADADGSSSSNRPDSTNRQVVQQLEAALLPDEQTLVYVARQGDGLLGSCGFADALRPEAAAVVAGLRARGLDVRLMSGDRAGAVAAAAAAAGVPHFQGDMAPEDKVAAVSALRALGRKVAMVGDGVNDAPALAGADVGIAVHGGMEAAGEAAGVVLLGDSLAQVEQAIDLGRATLSKIRANLTWALAYNLVGVPLAAGVLLPGYGVSLSPSVAGGLMAFSSVAVVSNSLLLRAQLGGGGTPEPPQLKAAAAPAAAAPTPR